MVPLVTYLLAGCAAPVIGLQPRYPQVRQGFFTSGMAFVEVDSWQPTLKWESFPPPPRPEADQEKQANRISRVTYDLRIWRAGKQDQPVGLIYERHGLPAPFHRVESPLEPAAKYLWTVRARFEIDDKPRVTDWGRTGFGNLQALDTIPNRNFYRFATPAN